MFVSLGQQSANRTFLNVAIAIRPPSQSLAMGSVARPALIFNTKIYVQNFTSFFRKTKKNNSGRSSTENDHHLTLSTFFYHLHSISCSRHSLLILINFIISFRLQIINVLLIRSMLRLKRRTTKLGMLEHFNLLIAIILLRNKP